MFHCFYPTGPPNEIRNVIHSVHRAYVTYAKPFGSFQALKSSVETESDAHPLGG